MKMFYIFETYLIEPLIMPQTLLHVLKASAGSGKTYSLVKTYLKLVLLSEDNRAFARIMAMTFTNKATLEMKERQV